jgi:phage shock protein C
MTNRLVIDRRRGMWLGVCQGLADFSGIDVALVRLALVLLTVFSAGFPAFVAYLLVGWLAGER